MYLGTLVPWPIASEIKRRFNLPILRLTMRNLMRKCHRNNKQIHIFRFHPILGSGYSCTHVSYTKFATVLKLTIRVANVCASVSVQRTPILHMKFKRQRLTELSFFSAVLFILQLKLSRAKCQQVDE